ncbi:MAG: ribosomal protein S18-alanine N-acetyltransferase [Lachnospiraceae bacterium]|nr:ribosomal protein S18-alanine N-acetyltransferase [Lachnospiraceae bacterium]
MIRKMLESDLDEVARIERACFTDPWSRESFREAIELPSSHYIVCEEDGKVAGYACLMYAADEGEIINIATDEPYRRKGMGEKLVYAMIEAGKALGVISFYLEVRKSNTAAHELYKKCGFYDIGVRKNYYSDPKEDAIVMKRQEGAASGE